MWTFERGLKYDWIERERKKRTENRSVNWDLDYPMGNVCVTGWIGLNLARSDMWIMSFLFSFRNCVIVYDRSWSNADPFFFLIILGFLGFEACLSLFGMNVFLRSPFLAKKGWIKRKWRSRYKQRIIFGCKLAFNGCSW